VVAERLGAGAARVRVLASGGDILGGSPEGQRESARRTLASQGVELLTGVRVAGLARDAASAAVGGEACTITLQRGEGEGATTEELSADLVLWTAGQAPATQGAREGFPFEMSPRGGLLTDATLRVRAHARVFALGDVSGPNGEEPLPATAQVAFQQADYAAWNLWAAINGRPLLPFRYQHLGSMMALGSRSAAVALPLSLPPELAAGVAASPLGPLLSLAGVQLGAGVTVEGPLGQLMRRAAYLYRQPTAEHRVQVAASWVNQAANMFSDLLSPPRR